MPDSAIVLIEDDVIVSDKKEVSEILNNFFVESVANLNIEPFLEDEPRNSPKNDDVDTIIRKYSNHPSILKIKENIKPSRPFEFGDVTGEKNKKDIRKIDPKKACVENDIPAKLFVETANIVGDYVAKIYNDLKNENNFDKSLKLGTVIPVNKTSTKTTKKKDLRPLTLLPMVSKLYERNMYDDILTYVESFLSPYIFGYRKNHSTEQCLTIMLERWKEALDSKFVAGGILTDLSKAFDCLNHELLIAKLEAYGFGIKACKFILDYLSNRRQRTKVGNTLSEWKITQWGVPQGSILGPLLFNLFINDIFFFLDKTFIANYADDNTQYATEKNVHELLNRMEHETSIVLNWFKINEMKSNDNKCHLIVPNETDVSVNIGQECLKGEDSVTLLGILIDSKLNFTLHIRSMLKKGNQKLHALARISKYVSRKKMKLIVETFIKSQFNYCPLLWMFHSRHLNKRINKLHKRALRLLYKNDTLEFQELLDLHGDVTIHQKNLQHLAIEMYKVKNGIAPVPFQNLFKKKEITHHLRHQATWLLPKVNTVNFGTETIRYRGPLIWESLPYEVQKSPSLQSFKTSIKKLGKIDCACRLCKTFIVNLGFQY